MLICKVLESTGFNFNLYANNSFETDGRFECILPSDFRYDFFVHCILMRGSFHVWYSKTCDMTCNILILIMFVLIDFLYLFDVLQEYTYAFYGILI